MKPSAASWLPSREQLARERERRAARAYAEELAEIGDPERPAWPPEADGDRETWIAGHWSQAARDEFEIADRAFYFEAMDTAMGALALAIWEAGSDEVRIRGLLERVGLPPWPPGSSAEEVRLHRRQWGAWENVYYGRWQEWTPLSEEERREAHEKEWRRHLWGEAMQARTSGPCWWRTMTMPNPDRVAAYVDLPAGLRLARERGHDETYPRPEGDEEGEEA